ncbi:MAG: glycine cleavage system aminomethyltransferase GcvT [Candidatus Dormibacteraeota bacterium]|nr:glycine cleavage system aminomethyltransferase GcvT [Candidatus Dormibacteraeota bacterium]
MPARTPLYDRHVAAGGRMVEFGGYEMPLQYSSIREEHVAVRTRAGLFDVSHMGRLTVGGDGALPSLQRLATNDVAKLEPSQSLYSMMCNERGGIVDDVIVNAEAKAGSYLVVVNAATHEKDVAWIRARLDESVGFSDITNETALLALQGPKAMDVLQRISDADLSALRPFHSTTHAVRGVDSKLSTVSRTGYTGEDGFELYCDASAAPQLWDAILGAGRDHNVLPCGLGARDTLRLEAGLRLYGQDMDDDTDPYSCALGWTVKLDKEDFIGADELRSLDPKNPPRRFIGLRLPERAIARHGAGVCVGERRVGTVTSGTFSFTLGYGIATASVHPDVTPEDPLSVDIRGTPVAAQRVPLPFYRRPKGA